MNIYRIFKEVCSITICLVAFSAHASPVDLRVVSDSQWKSNDRQFPGWETVAFDDSGWSPARAPYPNPVTPANLIPGTTAEHIWHDPDRASDGTSGSIHGYFRKSLDISIQPDSLPLLAQALISVDDDYELYVNGLLAFENKDGGFADVVDFVDFTRFLRNGTNVFAIHAVDGGWDSPRNRIYERVLFDARIATVPEPVTVLLAAFGIGMLAAKRHRHPE